MNHFYQALTSRVKNEALPEEFNFFGKLMGSWDIDYVDNHTSLLCFWYIDDTIPSFTAKDE